MDLKGRLICFKTAFLASVYERHTEKLHLDPLKNRFLRLYSLKKHRSHAKIWI